MSGFLYLDAEPTELSPERGARLEETAIDDSSGRTVFNPFLNRLLASREMRFRIININGDNNGENKAWYVNRNIQA